MAQASYRVPESAEICCVVCNSVVNQWHDIPENKRECVLQAALKAQIVCNKCEIPEEREEVITPTTTTITRADLIEWLQQNTGCSEKRANSLCGILPKSFDVVYEKDNRHVLAIMWSDAPFLGNLPANVVSPAFKGKVYVLVSPLSFELLHMRYTSLATAEANLSSARNNKSYNMDTCEQNVAQTKKVLIKSVEKHALKNIEEDQEEEEEEFEIESGPETPIKKRPLEEKKEEKKTEKKKRQVDRISTTEDAMRFLKQQGCTIKQAQTIVTELRCGKNKGGKVAARVEAKSKTFLRLEHALIKDLLTEGLVSNKDVSAPFDSNRMVIQKGNHVCVVLVPDENGDLYKTISNEPTKIKQIVSLLKTPALEEPFLLNYLEPEELEACKDRLSQGFPCYLNEAGDEVIIRRNALVPLECQNQYVKTSPFTRGSCFVAIENRLNEDEKSIYDLLLDDMENGKVFEEVVVDYMTKVKDF
jgi:hypothetical protein